MKSRRFDRGLLRKVQEESGGSGNAPHMAARGMLLALILIGVWVSAGAPLYADVPLTITYTADNVVEAWWQNGGLPVLQATGAHADDWRLADSVTLTLEQGHGYQFVWHVQNDGEGSLSNPAAFLAEIACAGDPNYNAVSKDDGFWQWAPVPMGDTAVTNFDSESLQWADVSVHATDGTQAWNGGDNIWTDNNSNGPVGGIAAGDTGAYWIWGPNNTGGDGYFSDIYIRYNATNFELVPEPFGISLLACSSLVLLVRRRRSR